MLQLITKKINAIKHGQCTGNSLYYLGKTILKNLLIKGTHAMRDRLKGVPYITVV